MTYYYFNIGQVFVTALVGLLGFYAGKYFANKKHNNKEK